MSALDLLSALVLEDGARWGERAHPFQLADAEAILDQDGPPYHFITRPRGAAKTADLAAIMVGAAIEQAPPGSRLYAAAADREQAALLVDSIRGYRERTPGLASSVDVQTNAVIFPQGVRLDTLPADGASIWGLRPWLAVADEICQWASTSNPRTVWAGLHSAMPKVPGSRLVALSSAGDPSHWSRRILEAAEVSPLWRVSELPGPTPWIPIERLEELRLQLSDSLYRRLVLNEWVEAEDALVTVDDLRACVSLHGPQPPRRDVGRYVVALDLGLVSDRTVAAVLHREPTGPALDGERRSLSHRVVLDRMSVWAGSRAKPVSLQDVEDWVCQAVEEYRPADVVLDPWQAVGLGQRLRSRGILVREFTFSSASVGWLASTLAGLLRNRALALPPDEDLLAELARVRLRETTPGVVRMDHAPGEHDDRAITLALGAWWLLQRAGSGEMRVFDRRSYSEPVYRSGDLVLVGERYIDKPSPSW